MLSPLSYHEELARKVEYEASHGRGGPPVASEEAVRGPEPGVAGARQHQRDQRVQVEEVGERHEAGGAGDQVAQPGRERGWPREMRGSIRGISDLTFGKANQCTGIISLVVLKYINNLMNNLYKNGVAWRMKKKYNQTGFMYQVRA